MSVRRGSRSGTSRRQEPDSIAKNAAASLASQVTTASLTAVLTLFLVRALGANEYGLFALTMGVGAITLAFADVGLSLSTARFVAEHRGHGTELRALVADALKLKIVVTALVCATLAALASVIASIYREPDLVWPLRVMALATFGQSTYLMLLGVSTARGRTILNIRLVAAESLLEVSASIALVLAGAGAVGAVFGRAIGYVLGAAVAAIVVLRLSGEGPMRLMSFPRRETIRQVGGYARAVFAIDVSYTATASVSVLILGAYAGSAASGIYQAPAKLITLIMYVGLSVANGVAPRLARAQGRKPDVAPLQGALRGLIDFQCLMLAPAVVWAKPITHLLLGAGYARSADVLAALAPFIFFSGLAPLVTTSVNYMGEAQRRIPIAFATLAVAVAAGFLLIPSHGVIGAAIATDIAFGVYTLAHIWLCRGLLQLRIGVLVWSLVCGLTAAGAMAIVLASIGTEHLTVRDWLTGAVGGVAAFVAMLVFTREIRRVHIARAAAMVAGLFARQQPEPESRPSPRPAVLPQPTGLAVTPPTAASVSPDATPRRSTAIRPRVGGAETGRGRRDGTGTRRLVRFDNSTWPPTFATESVEVGSESVEAGSESVSVGAVSDDVVVEGPSPAAKPPAWLGGSMYEVVFERPVPVSRSRAAGEPGWAAEAAPGKTVPSVGEPAGPDGEGDGPAPAARPPAWLSNTVPSTADTARGGADKAPRQPQHAAPPDGGAGTSGSRRVMYQIVWRLGSDGGVFELSPAEASDAGEAVSGEAPAKERSAPVPWAWLMPPAPNPEARRAHRDFVDRLLAAGWRGAGVGDAWFAHRFRPPDQRLQSNA